MKDPESAESKEKLNLRFFRFLFFELWSFFGHFFDVITLIFVQFFMITRKIKIGEFFIIIFFILFNTHRIIYKNKTERGRGVYIPLIGKRPVKVMKSTENCLDSNGQHLKDVIFKQ